MIKLSGMFRDPALKSAFERAERDSGGAYAVADPKAPVLLGGAAALTPSIRARIEMQVERLIEILDRVDGDENLEPYLAGTYPDEDDREADDERENDPAELGIADEGGLAEQAPYYDAHNKSLALYAM